MHDMNGSFVQTIRFLIKKHKKENGNMKGFDSLLGVMYMKGHEEKVI